MTDSVPVYPWLQADYQRLWHSYQHNRLHHALLFGSAQGLGVEQLVQHLAQAMLCTAPGDQGACQQCKGCQLYRAQTHPDLYWLEPEKTGAPIRIDAIRQIIAPINECAHQGGAKVIVLQQAGRLNLNAANALLKVLEEPAPNTYFFLLDEQITQLLPTLRSRCRQQVIKRPDEAQICAWLQTQFQAEVSLLRRAVARTGGLPLRALVAISEQGLAWQQHWQQGLIQLLQGQCSAVELAAQWQSIAPLETLAWLLQAVHACLIFKQAGQCDALQALELDVLQQKTALFDMEKLFMLYDQLLTYTQQLMRLAPLNTTLLLESILMQWQQLLDGVTVDGESGP